MRTGQSAAEPGHQEQFAAATVQPTVYPKRYQHCSTTSRAGNTHLAACSAHGLCQNRTGLVYLRLEWDAHSSNPKALLAD